MVEYKKYEDKSIDTIKKDVETEFKKIDKWGQRDDREIFQSGINICKKYIDEIKRDEDHDDWAIKPLTELQTKIENDINKLKWYSCITNNKEKIDNVALNIDDAEEEILKRLEKNHANKESENILKQSNERKWIPLFTLDGNKNLIFTKASNPIRIDQALNWLFDNPDIVYQIDYTNCTNEKIRNKMTSIIWTQTCYLKYDKLQKTYTIRNENWDWIYNRALIREWVKLIPDWVRKRWAYQELKEAEKDLWKEDIANIDTNVKNMLTDMPSAKSLNQDQQKKLFTLTDERILELLKKAKKLWYELGTECITKRIRWLMELHLVSWSSEKDVVFWEDNSKIWKDLYKFLDNNESEYKIYLTKRVKQKRAELDSLTKIETINLEKDSSEALNENEEEREQHKQQVLYGISLFDKMIDNFRESTWDSRQNDNDKYLVEIKKLIRNAQVSIANTKILDDNTVTKNFINPIRQKWRLIQNIADEHMGGGYKVKNPDVEIKYNHLQKVFFWKDMHEQIRAVRELWWYIGYWTHTLDQTKTSFLKDEIIKEKINYGWLRVENEDINKCIAHLEFWFSRPIYEMDESWEIKKDQNNNPIINEKVKRDFDIIMDASHNYFKENVIYLLVNDGILPKNWQDKKDDFYECVEKYENQIQIIEDQEKSFSETPESMRKKQHLEKLRLEQKENKTEMDMQALQSLNYLESNKELQDEINKKTIESMKIELKYWNLGQITKACFFPALAELWWWAKWASNDIYNDIIWYWRWNLSDETASQVETIATEIAITVAVAVVTWGIWWIAVAGALRWATALARSARWMKLANNITKLVKLNELWMKWFKTANAVWKISMLTSRATWLLIEGTTFNAASEMIHSAMNGTSLDNLKLNPVARENIQTAAFLWALSITGKLTQSLMKLWWSTKLTIDLPKWLEKAAKTLQTSAAFTTSLVTEMWSMLAAEQVINIVFWHDIIDSETWEIITSHEPQAPTEQELIQMVWMILAFKAVKPWLWAKYEKQINDWTLKIYRWTKKNEILLKDSKTWKIERIQDLIDWQYNNYKPTPEQQKLRNHNQRIEKQSKYNAQYTEARKIISKLPENLRSEAMKKFLETWDMIESSPNDVKRIQKEIWLTWKNIDGILGPESLSKLKKYVKWLSRSKVVVNETWNEWGRVELQEWTPKSEEITRKLDEIKEQIQSWNYGEVKLNWATQKMFETWVFIEWIKNRFKWLKPGTKLPKEFLKKMKDGLVDMKNKWWEKLSEYHKNLVDKWNKFLERKLAEKWNEVEVIEREINQIEKEIEYTKDVNWNILPENYERMSAEELVQEYKKLEEYEASGERDWRELTPEMSIPINSHDCSTQKTQIRKILEKKYKIDTKWKLIPEKPWVTEVKPNVKVWEWGEYTLDVNWNILPENYEKMSAEELVQEYQHLRDYEAEGIRIYSRTWEDGTTYYKNLYDKWEEKSQIRKILKEKFWLDRNGKKLIKREEQQTIQQNEHKIETIINNFSNENGRFEISYIERSNTWSLTLREKWTELWNLQFKVRDNCIYIDTLISFKKWSGTELMRKIVELSEALWKWWHIELTASPYIDAGRWKKSYRSWLTNLWFYYKLGFRAKDPKIHKKIQEYIDKWEDIPLWLNARTDIYLSDEWIQNLKMQKSSTKSWKNEWDIAINKWKQEDTKAQEKIQREKQEKEQQWLYDNNFFNIEWINSIETLEEKWNFLYFERSKRKEFNDAISDKNFQLAKSLYIEALRITKNKLENVWLTPEQNKYIIECFRKRDYEGIKQILNETKDIIWKNREREDTEHKYSKKIIDKETWQERIEYDNNKKALYMDPITEKETLMTRKEFHERIIEKFLLDWEASKWNKQLILSWGLPGAGKSTIEKYLEGIPKVIVNPDLVKDYLPEYYDENWRKFGAEIVHEESSYISKLIYDRAVEWWYSILYDSSMKDKPSEGFPKYNKIVESAYKQGYTIEARFIYDWWESRYRNSVLRERSMWLSNYNAYWTAYKTIKWLSENSKVKRIVILDNSARGSTAKIVYENQKINETESDPELRKKFDDYQLFLDKLL